jgi:hypothetical protein
MALSPFSLDRMVRAVELVRERLLRATGALEKAGIPYAVAGGNAVAAWVARVDESAVRNTPNVELLIERKSLEAVKAALAEAGFVHRPTEGNDFFLDGPEGKTREAVQIHFCEKPLPAVEPPRLMPLESLVRNSLDEFRRIHRVYLRDLLDVGLIDASWGARFPPLLAQRLQTLIDDPNG